MHLPPYSSQMPIFPHLLLLRGHGAAALWPIRGSLLTLCRVARCQPFGRPGYDPVPQRFSLRPFAGAEQEKQQAAHPSQPPVGENTGEETIPHENGNGGPSL